MASSKVRTRGQVTLPREILKGLRAKEGEELTWFQIADGVVMLSKTSTRRERIAENLLTSLVVEVGKSAEKKGIRQEEDLDTIVASLRKRSFGARHG
ncbi:MAG: AbrB/MazE/SpoVT family DNA-binding domain-containing protein [Chloroflexi bacterium]|nr:AbrB/MazE/SpoVT family DNA-binding domain-containing protein [Chloroflexota bacterium]